jgi:hypothetical protein
MTHGPTLTVAKRALAVDRPAQAIHDPAEQRPAHGNRQVLTAMKNRNARLERRCVLIGHKVRKRILESDHLGSNGMVLEKDIALVADGGRERTRQNPGRTAQLPRELEEIKPLDVTRHFRHIQSEHGEAAP